jgi:undecaprenyl-phosphate 4-deoxy-4-formamido-L-arabinose transferase
MKVSIIIPVYNSSKMLIELCNRISTSMQSMKLNEDFELLMVNDYSTDDSWSIIKGLSKKHNYIKGINLEKNFGQHNAIMAGLNNSKGEYIITIDDDLQHPPEFIPSILKKLDEFDVCYTNYRNRKHISWKRFVSQLNNIVSSFILNKPLKIYMSSFRGFTKNVKLKLIEFKKPDVYLDGLILSYTKKIGMINIEHHERKFGESNYDFKKLFILWSNMILNFSFFPFRLASIFGFLLKVFIKLLRKKNLNQQFQIKEIIENNEKN